MQRRALLLTALFALASWPLLVRLENRPYRGAARLLTGERFPRFSVRDIATREWIAVPSAPTTFLIYIGSRDPENLDVVEYADQLARGQTLKERQRISFVVVTGRIYPAIETMRREGELTLPLARDTHWSIARALEIPEGTDAFFEIARTGRIAFYPNGGLISLEDLREIYQRASQGRITYTPGPPLVEALKGTKFPDLTIKDLRTGAVRSLYATAPPGGAGYLVYAGDCSICTLQAAFATLTAVQPPHATGPTPIFSGRFAPSLLVSMADSAHYRGPLYQSQGTIPGLESALAPTRLPDGGILIRTDGHGIVRSVTGGQR